MFFDGEICPREVNEHRIGEVKKRIAIWIKGVGSLAGRARNAERLRYTLMQLEEDRSELAKLLQRRSLIETRHFCAGPSHK